MRCLRMTKLFLPGLRGALVAVSCAFLIPFFYFHSLSPARPRKMRRQRQRGFEFISKVWGGIREAMLLGCFALYGDESELAIA